MRVRFADHKIEEIASLKDLRRVTGSKNQTKTLKTRHGLVWFFIYFRGPQALTWL
jgi:hypothetical protein